jgi:NTE family protein
MNYHRIMRGTFMDGAYGGFSLEVGRVRHPLLEESPDNLLKSASIYIGSDTPIGPVYLGYGRATDGNDAFYFFLGKPY